MAHGPPTVVLTRSTDDNTALADRLTVAGVLVLELPTVCMTQVAPDQSQAELNELVRRAPALAFTSRQTRWRHSCPCWTPPDAPAPLPAGRMQSCLGKTHTQCKWEFRPH